MRIIVADAQADVARITHCNRWEERAGIQLISRPVGARGINSMKGNIECNQEIS
jgi:hypothetical protein